MEIQHGIYQENIFNLFSSIRETYKQRVEETLQNLERHFLNMLEDVLTDAEKRFLSCANFVKESDTYTDDVENQIEAQAIQMNTNTMEKQEPFVPEEDYCDEDEEKDMIEGWFSNDVIPALTPSSPLQLPDTEHLKREPQESQHLLLPTTTASTSCRDLHDRPIVLPDKVWNECPHCDRKFRQYSKLKMHIAAQHSAQNPFQCNICRKGFSRNDSLLRHIRTKHNRLMIDLPRSKPSPASWNNNNARGAGGTLGKSGLDPINL